MVKIIVCTSTYYLNVPKCQDPDLNWRHEDFQSTALPTELSRLKF